MTDETDAQHRAASVDQLRAIVRKHALGDPADMVPMSTIGYVNDVWLVDGRFVVRIPRRTDGLGETWNERVAAPAAHV